EQMIVRLGSLLRHTTETGSQEVPLEREIEFLRAYLEIEQARFHDRLTVGIDVPDELLGCSVPSLILQPLVENAIRHGTGRLAGAGTVRIAAARQGDTLVLRVADNGPGLRPPGPDRGTGVSLRNIRSRLRHLYGNAAGLQLGPAEEGGLEATVSLPCRPAPAPQAASTTGGVDSPAR
ncbi:MAG TPA: histidine kinase, partial [Longimicrobiaceae bacterium]|nr:histidine kinase [Longimicrobiaceae bacterium]